MKFIFAAVLSIAALIGCANYPEEGQSAQSSQISQENKVAAATVTVPIPVGAPFNGTGVHYYYASSQDAFGNNLKIIPVYVVPVGATLVDVKARVQGNLAERCWFVVYQQTDFSNIAPIMSSNQTSLTLPMQTVEATANFVVSSLKPLFLNFGPNFDGSSSCELIAAEATYIPPL